jgi:hypothetical protein
MQCCQDSTISSHGIFLTLCSSLLTEQKSKHSHDLRIAIRHKLRVKLKALATDTL